MKEIEEQAINTYQNNMLYLTKEHPNLAKDVNNLDLAIQNNIHVSQYDLEYVNGNFDIKDINSGKYMYAEHSNDFAKNTAKKITFDKVNGSIECLSIIDISKMDIENREAIKYKEDVFSLMSYHINNVSSTNVMKHIRKFIFIGVGLGLHIAQIDKKVNATDYLIVEDNLEIFKLSLFTTAYYDIAKRSRLTFSILEDNITFTKTFDIFLQNNFAYNRLFKYVRVKNHSDEKISLIQSAIANQSSVVFPYKKRLEMNIRPLNYINNDYKFLNLHHHIKNDFFTDKPILLLAAGPSFKKNIKWIKEHHHKFITITVSALLKTLHSHNIKPDIVTHIDGSDANRAFFEGFNIKEYLKNSIFIFSAGVPENIIKTLPKEQIYLFENLTKYHKGCNVPTTECVGSFSLLLSIFLSTKNIYVTGLDLAFNQETGETHADGHSKNQTVDISDSGKMSTETSLISSTLPVIGNFKDVIYTNPLLHGSIKSLERIVPEIISDDQTIYNMSEGAKISNSSALKVDDIDMSNFTDIDKSMVSNSLQTIFKDSSTKTLHQNDMESLKQEFEISLRIKTLIDNFANKSSYVDSDEYIGELIALFINIMKTDNKGLCTILEVYYDYFFYALVIVEDFFNTRNTKNTKRHIKKFNSLILTALYSIQDSYEDAFRLFIEEKG
ncbi:MAG: hypothetical protein COB99_05275 [Sulfurimonas sp.]|nr:MAG: hypothetical protein COB99_05275 [Sulfurimonas sp.]